LTWVTAHEDGVRLTIRVQPRAGRTGVAGVHGDALGIRLSSPPVDGAANRELVAFLSRALGRPKSAIAIERGEKGRRKRVLVRGIAPQEVLRALSPR